MKTYVKPIMKFVELKAEESLACTASLPINPPHPPHPLHPLHPLHPPHPKH